MNKTARDLQPGDSIKVDGVVRVAASVEISSDPHGYRDVTVEFEGGGWKVWAINDKVEVVE